jgi:hypothetical protein
VQSNGRLIDTDVAVSYEGSEEAAAQGKEGVAVSLSLSHNKSVSCILSRFILKGTHFAFTGICSRGPSNCEGFIVNYNCIRTGYFASASIF